MLRLSVAREFYAWACKLCTFVLLASQLTSNLNGMPVLFGVLTPVNSSAAEEETHSVVRCVCARQIQVRIRSLSVRSAAPLLELSTPEAPLCTWRTPQPRILPCFVGSGIRMRC